jgi:5-methylcytosine-specific restriction enzyme subunit McrC
MDISFSETDPTREEVVTPLELRALRRARHGLIVDELSDEGEGGVRLRLGPKPGYAGSVTLPGGRRIIVHTKAKVQSLPEVLALAYRTLAPPPRIGRTHMDSATPTEWLLVQLAAEVQELLGRGLRRGYIERRASLPFVRGRTRPILNPTQLPFLDCEFADFVSDTPENQLLRGVLELLAPAVKNPAVRRAYDDALSYLGDVSLIRPSLAHFDRVSLNRLNQHYKPSLRLARLALEGSGVVDSAGDHAAAAFFVRMWRVWENAAASALRDAGATSLLEKPRYSDIFVQDNGYPSRSVTIEPDLVIGRRLTPNLVIDLKWAPALIKRHGRLQLNNSHLYQMASYTSGLGCDGVLLYPLMDEEVKSAYVFGGRRITIRTVDLSQPGLAGLREAASEIVATL